MRWLFVANSSSQEPRLHQISFDNNAVSVLICIVYFLGVSSEASVVALTTDCYCTVCCQDAIPCAVYLDKICFCNEICRVSDYYLCCNNENLCDNETVVPPQSLWGFTSPYRLMYLEAHERPITTFFVVNKVIIYEHYNGPWNITPTKDWSFNGYLMILKSKIKNLYLQFSRVILKTCNLV